MNAGVYSSLDPRCEEFNWDLEEHYGGNFQFPKTGDCFREREFSVLGRCVAKVSGFALKALVHLNEMCLLLLLQETENLNSIRR